MEGWCLLHPLSDLDPNPPQELLLLQFERFPIEAGVEQCRGGGRGDQSNLQSWRRPQTRHAHLAGSKLHLSQIGLMGLVGMIGMMTRMMTGMIGLMSFVLR